MGAAFRQRSIRPHQVWKLVGTGVTILWEYPWGKESPCRLPIATLRCDAARHPGRTAPSRLSGLPFIPVRAWWGKAENSGGRCCARWSVCWWERTWLSVQPCTVRHKINGIYVLLTFIKPARIWNSLFQSCEAKQRICDSVNHYMKNHSLHQKDWPSEVTVLDYGFLCLFLTHAKQEKDRWELGTEKRGGFNGNTYTNIIIILYLCSHF